VTCSHCQARDDEQAFAWSCSCHGACETPWCPMALEAETWHTIRVPMFGNHKAPPGV